MATFDAHKNFAVTQVLTAPSPAISGTSLVVSTGGGALFPAAPFNCVVYPSATYPLNTSAEIVRVTSIVGDTLTIVRAQEGSSARTIIVGDTIGNVTSAKVFTDIENAINALPQSAIQSISIGTNAASGPTIVFSNSNNVSFGLSGSTITASASVAGGGGAAISAGANSQSSGTIVFSSSNGISFGLATNGVLTASHNGITSQSVQTQNGVSIQGSTGAISFSNSNNVTFGFNASVITASFAGGGGGAAISAGTNSQSSGTIVFSSSNGISFGLATNGVLTASHNGLTSQSNQAFSASGGSSAFQTIEFRNANGISFSNSGGVLEASVNHMNIGISNTGNASGTTGTVDGAGGQYVFFGGNNITLSQSLDGQSATLSIIGASGGGAAGSIAAGGSTLSLGQVVFSNSNNISFGINGSTLTASVDHMNIGVSTGGNTGGTTGTIDGSAGQYVFFGGNNITLSQSVNSQSVTLSIIGAAGGAGNTLKYYENPGGAVNVSLSSYRQSTSFVAPIQLQNALSFDFVRLIGTGTNAAASTTAATTGNTQFSCGYTASHNICFYSLGTGASSNSLQSYFSTQILENYSHNVSCATNSTQFSYSVRYTMPHSTGFTFFTQDYSASAASLQFSSNGLTAFSGTRALDFKVGTTLSAGNWWMAYGCSSTSSSQFTSVGFRNIFSYGIAGVTQNSWQVAPIGTGAFNASFMPGPSAGSFTTAGGGTTASLNLSNISILNFNMRPYVQLMATS